MVGTVGRVVAVEPEVSTVEGALEPDVLGILVTPEPVVSSPCGATVLAPAPGLAVVPLDAPDEAPDVSVVEGGELVSPVEVGDALPDTPDASVAVLLFADAPTVLLPDAPVVLPPELVVLAALPMAPAADVPEALAARAGRLPGTFGRLSAFL